MGDDSGAAERIAFRLNGEGVTLAADVPAAMTVLHWLRGSGRLHGTKEGCAEGDCGACTIVLERPDGGRTPVNACLLMLGQIHGRSLRTVEGLRHKAHGVHPVQEAMAKANATQCGFCTPGIVMSAWAYAREGGDPHDALAGNLCRCTGYRPILDAFAAMGDDDAPAPAPLGGGAGRFSAPGHTFYSPDSMEGLLALRAAHQDAALLAGGTDLGLKVAEGWMRPEKIICLLNVPELNALESRPEGLWVGAAVSYERLLRRVEADGGLRLRGMVPLLRRLGSRQIRGLGTLGGNLGTASPIGDALPPLLALEARVRLRSAGSAREMRVEEFLRGYRVNALRSDEVIESVLLPRPAADAVFVCEKVSKRHDQDIATVGASFLVEIGGGRVRAARLAFGGMGPIAARAKRAEAALVGAAWSEQSVARAAAALASDFAPLSDWRGTAEYRVSTAAGLLRRLWWRVARPDLALEVQAVGGRMTDATLAIEPRTAGLALAHDSALKHCTGEARFLDDLAEPPGLLHAALALAGVAHGRLEGVDTASARSVSGVVAVLCAGDIPGRNDVAPAGRDEALLAEGVVEHAGQPVALVVARTREAALQAAELVRADIAPLPAILSIEAALAQNRLLLPPMNLAQGDAELALASAPRLLQAEFRCGGQEHFYLEGQIAMAVPGEDGDLTIHSSTQHPTEVQHIAARVLGREYNRITVAVRRSGGGFGGKESNASWVGAAAALAAVHTGRPVKLRLSRRVDMAATGKRHPFLFRYRAGFDDSGRILCIDAVLAADGGHTLDLSAGTMMRAITHALNCCAVPNVRLCGMVCKTNRVSNTAFRGFGGPQGVLLMEDVIYRVAHALRRTPEEVRERNFAGGENASETPYGQTLEGDLIRRVWAEAREGAAWDRRRAEVAAFNASHPVLRRGLGSFVLAFGISFGIPHLNQAGALVHVYTDGSVRLNHGGTEMGQGLFIKVAQIVADVFGIDAARIAITATSTAEVPNTSPTAASTGTDLNGWAAHQAASAIRGRMAAVAAARFGVGEEEVRFEGGLVFAGLPGGNRSLGFGELAELCWKSRVSLSATGFYKTPDLRWDPVSMKGSPFFYFSYGASVAEVLVDTLTGESRVVRADLVQDCGRSLNPAVDRGQIEGGFVQGQGWLTCEELWWDGAGRLRTVGPSTYKIPGSRDVPPVFNVHLLQGAPARANTIFRSKAVGEPPLMLATAIWNALKDAIGTVDLDLPATPDRILAALRRGDRGVGEAG